ncbi:MAG: DUF881 domain-containing protein [Chloroflexi bacterium]|nr:MAG: DUF881 domain-containing protein [Chloroflexota bacterium]TME47047.1 MAG: DUF881 domain-containing protein [Chloroflexota bacterium]
MRSQSAEQTARGQRLIIVSLIGIALGFLLVLQLRSQATVAATLAAQDDTSIALLINDLNKANNQLLQQGADLSQQETQLRQALSSGGSDAQAIQKELTTLQLVNGEIPVHGPGLTIHMQGGIMDFELQDVLNSLRQASGEAFSVNSYRVTSSTPIISKGNSLLVGGHSIGGTLVLDVIGDPEQLGPAADLAVTSLQTRVQIVIQRSADLAITEVVTPHPLIYGQLGR